MKITDALQLNLQQQLDDPRLNADTVALLRCQTARELVESGNYEAARAAMGNLWQRVGERPRLADLSQSTQAEVLLRAGALSGWIGSAQQIDGAQETAKDMITESLSIFSELGEIEKRAEAQVDLAICYWREGAFEEARAMLTDSLALVTSGVQRGRALMNLAIVEMAQLRHNEALQCLREAAPIFESYGSKELQGRNHLQLALAYKKLFALERREDHFDLALVEATAASYHFEETGNQRYEAIVNNNLGGLYTIARKFVEAHSNLDRARRLFENLNDRVNVARVDDSRARAFLAQGRLKEAGIAACAAVNALEHGEELAVLAEALTTQGKVLAQQQHRRQAREVLERAVEVAECAGDLDGAGLACLTILEELIGLLTLSELVTTYKRADAFLERNSERETATRLRHCARLVLQAIQYFETTLESPPEETLNLKEQTARFVRRFEAQAIKRALDEAGGGITEAARRLGLKHQTLAYKLKKHNGELDSSRKPPRKRYRSIIKKG